MAKVTRYQFIGRPWLVVLLCWTIVGIPLAAMYYVSLLLAIEEEVKNPEDLLDYLKRK
jgi:TM2 domain-containing membrane protein YozV